MFKKSFCGTGKTLEIGRQQDSNSCGIYVVNSIEHHMFGTPLFTHDERNALRAYYFTKAIEYLLDGVRIKSSPTNEQYSPPVISPHSSIQITASPKNRLP